MIFFTADHHFGHKNIIKHCDRPFPNVEKMDEVMLENWNKVVSEKDTVYHLGDIFWYRKPEEVIPILGQLNGRIILIRGNHDKGNVNKFSDFYSEVYIYHKIRVDIGESTKKKIIMMHYPLESWESKGSGSWHLHGHCHGMLRNIRNRHDVGVDTSFFAPISLVGLIEIMKIRDRAFKEDKKKWEK